MTSGYALEGLGLFSDTVVDFVLQGKCAAALSRPPPPPPLSLSAPKAAACAPWAAGRRPAALATAAAAFFGRYHASVFGQCDEMKCFSATTGMPLAPELQPACCVVLQTKSPSLAGGRLSVNAKSKEGATDASLLWNPQARRAAPMMTARPHRGARIARGCEPAAARQAPRPL